MHHNCIRSDSNAGVATGRKFRSQATKKKAGFAYCSVRIRGRGRGQSQIRPSLAHSSAYSTLHAPLMGSKDLEFRK